MIILINMPSQNQNQIAKTTKQIILTGLCHQIDLQKQAGNGCVSMGFVAGLAASHRDVCPWVSRDTVNYELCKRKILGIYYECPDAILATTSVTDITQADFDAIIANRAKGGRHAGTTDKRNKSYELASLAAKNEITERYARNKRKAGTNRLPRGHLTRIMRNVKKRNVLPDVVLITESYIWQRIKTNTLRVVAGNSGPLSPLHAYEMEFIQVILQMMRMRESLSPSEIMQLINSMIDGTQAQTDLITFKSKKWRRRKCWCWLLEWILKTKWTFSFFKKRYNIRVR